MEAWGAWTLATALDAGLLGAVLLAAAALLGSRPRPAALLLALGLLRFCFPRSWLVPIPGPELGPVAGGGASALDPWSFLALAAWAQALGLLTGTWLLARSVVGLRRTLRRSERVAEGALMEAARSVAVRHGTAVPPLWLTDGGTPAAAGFLRPAVLVPRDLAARLDAAALERVLAHEIVHAARRDPLLAGLRTLIVSAWWFHPVVWALAGRHRAAREDACDDAVVARAPGGARAYCATLLQCATGGRPPLLAAGLGGHPLERRFRRLLGGRRTSRPAALVTGLACAAALAALPLRVVHLDPGAGPRGDADEVRREVVVRDVVRRQTVRREPRDRAGAPR